MNKKDQLFKLLICLFLSFSSFQLLGAPAYPHLIEKEQPDGEKIKVKLKGDEFFSYETTEDDYVVVKNQKGYYVYSDVTTDEESFAPSAIVVRDKSKRTKKETDFLKSAPKGLTENQRNYAAMRAMANKIIS